MQTLGAILALLVFSGDVLDDVPGFVGYVETGKAPQAADQQKGSTPKSSASHHHDTACISTPVVLLSPALPGAFEYVDVDEANPAGLPASIDHPPQLA